MRALSEVQRLLLGRPIATSAAGEERLTRPRALGAFGLDALSSVAYGPDEILYVLLLAGSAGLAFDVPVASCARTAPRLGVAQGTSVPLEIIDSPYREVIGPLSGFIREQAAGKQAHQVTVVMPEVVSRRWWQELLHNQTNLQLQLALRGVPGVVLTTVPVCL